MTILQHSNAAKAAAILHMTSGVPTPEAAVILYDEVMACDDYLIDECLEAAECERWEPVSFMHPLEWLRNVDTLAGSIDACRAD